MKKIKSLLKEAHKSIRRIKCRMIKLYNRFSALLLKFLPHIFLTLGAVMIYTAKAYEFEIKYFSEISEKLGTTIFASGVFAAILKSFQFTGIFKEELEKIILGTDFIKKRNDLPELWKKVSNAVYKSKFPEISSELDDIILNHYFPTEKKYYYKDYTVTVNIEELTDEEVISYTQTTVFELVPALDVEEFNLEYSLRGEKLNGVRAFENTIEYFKINKVDRGLESSISETSDDVTINYSFLLEGKGPFLIERKEKRQYSLKHDNTKLVRTGTFTKGMELSIMHPENVKVTFFNLGLVNQFEKKHVEFLRCVSRIHKKGIILPYQGFGLSFRKN